MLSRGIAYRRHILSYTKELGTPLLLYVTTECDHGSEGYLDNAFISLPHAEMSGLG